MSVINKLAISLGRRDEEPNKELARQIVKSNNKTAVKELIEALNDKDKNIQSDSIKVLYEVGESKPELISGYGKVFIELLSGKNNRMIWGAMIALEYIASINSKEIYKNLPLILATAEKGTVITMDHAIGILTKLAREKNYADKALSLLLERFRAAPTNQLPMYAENSVAVITDKYKKDFIKVLTKRLTEIEKESKQKRVEKVIKKLSS